MLAQKIALEKCRREARAVARRSLQTVSISDKTGLWADAADLIPAAAQPLYAGFRCGFDVVFFAAFSFACFLPEIASSICFCPAAAFFGFFVAHATIPKHITT
ncbi:hypothetical protein ACFIOY_20090 [Bradyrhizobium sp. TZ2]